jgi:hypothetical protein
MAGFGGFRPAAFRFLRDLERNNAKAWFEANRNVYEREVREPMRLLVETLDVTLGSIAPEIVGDSKRSMFRIHRDVRFSKNKSPYKTNGVLSASVHDTGPGASLRCGAWTPRAPDGRARGSSEAGRRSCRRCGGDWTPGGRGVGARRGASRRRCGARPLGARAARGLSPSPKRCT